MGENSAVAGLPPIGVDPTDWYQLQRKQMMVQALTQQALTPIQENNFPGQRIRSRIGPVQPVAQILAAYLADSKGKSLAADQGRMYQQSMVPFGGAPPADPSQQQDQGQPASPPPAAQASSPGAGAGGGAPSPAPTGAAPGGGPAPAQGGGATSMNPIGLPPAVAMRAFMQDPAKYGELIAGPEGWRTIMMATGGDAAAARRLAIGKLVKEGTLEVRKGGLLIGKGPDGQPFELRNPDLPTGMDPRFDAHGNVVGATLIPGVAEGEQAMQQAQQTGKEAGSIHELETVGGGHTTVFGIPPNMRGAPAPGGGSGAGGGQGGSAPPNYFAGATRTPQGPQAAGGATAPGGADLFASMPKRQSYEGSSEFGSDPHATIMNSKEAEKEIELRDKYGDESDLADQRRAFNSIALDALPNAETGPLADTINGMRQKAQEMGVPEEMIPGWAKVAPSQEMKKALVRNAIVSLKPNFGGRPAAAEFQVLKEEANPSDKMTALAIKRLLQIDNELADYQKQRSQDFDTAMTHGGSALRFQNWYSHQRPVQAKMEAFLHPASASDVKAEIARRAAAQAKQ